MRVLFYGGCHAAALRRIFEQYGQGVDVKHITNFVLIKAKKPFPYEDLRQFDWVVYNPILNKEEHNTVHLQEFARANGIKTLSYPWLQWEGYYPTAKKLSPDWYAGWWLSGLDAVAAQSASFDAFCEQVIEGSALATEAHEHLERTTGFLKRLESHADLNVSDFVLSNYQTQRLFLTPDHATTTLYKHLVRQIADAIGCTIDGSFYWTSQEVQKGIQIPVLPSIARALGLTFAAGDFQNDLVYGDRIFPLREFLKLHYFKDKIRVATAKRQTRIYTDPENKEAKNFPIFVEDRLLAYQINAEKTAGYREFGILTPLKTEKKLPALAGRNAYMYPNHWDYTKKVKPITPSDEKPTVG